MQTEVLQLAVAIVVIVLVLLLMRRAGNKSRAKSTAGVRERLGVEEAVAPKRKRPIREKKPAKAEEADKIWKQIRKTSREILAVDAKPVDLSAKKPFVLLVLGVNGVGKTTTIGKL